MKSKISHIEINVLNYSDAIKFYDLILTPMGIKRVNCMKDWTAYSDGQTKLILGRTEDEFKAAGYHRKRAGLNHLAFYANSKEDVDKYHDEVLVPNGIEALYEKKPFGDNEYYAVFFEGPDRLKLEYVFAPNYCDENVWPTNLEDDFDPYSAKADE
jgi:catechol 2,3-dioxygenase-like lactoylglutathione lyase family enzyme